MWRALHEVVGGTYVDVGAADPDEDSITRAFYERGWTGVDIEPVPEYASALRSARPNDQVVERAIGAEPGTASLRVAVGTGWSTLAQDVVLDLDDDRIRTVDVEVCTLDAVLADLGYDGRDIHFLKIDVEGYEREVLVGTDLARWRPWVVVIEATAPASTVQTHDRWEDLLLSASYRFCLFDGLNRYYVHPDHEDLAPALSFTVSPFDQPFERIGSIRERAHLRDLIEDRDREVTVREQEIERLASELHRLNAVILERDVEQRRLNEHILERNAEVGRLAVAIDELRDRLGEQLESQAAEIDRLNRSIVADELRIDALRRAQDVSLADSARWRHESLVRRAQTAEMGRHAHQIEMARVAIATVADRVGRELELTHATLSWRVTRPLRAVRRRQLIRKRSSGPEATPPAALAPVALVSSTAPDDRVPLLEAWYRRLQGASTALNGGARDERIEGTLDRFEEALRTSEADDMAKAWLSVAATMARYPDERELRQAAHVLRRDGPRGLMVHLSDRWEADLQHGRASDRDVVVLDHAVLVDVTHTAQHDLQTGIQRVVREVVQRWIDEPRVAMVWWDYGATTLRPMSDAEVDRLRDWRRHLPETAGTEMSVRSLDASPTAVVIPWNATMIVPELSAEPDRTGAYRALAISGVLREFSIIGYDLIPITAAETVTRDMSSVFSLYLAMVKYTTRVSAISEAAASDFTAFNLALRSQGLTGPIVSAHTLPPSPSPVNDATIADVRAELDLGGLPIVLVVGSHEPRKNHLAILEAAESLWSAGLAFGLVFIGGSGWNSDDFDAEVGRLLASGCPLVVRKRATEDELWSAYRLARFTVFPSFVEGYGLPIVESLASGTPAITSSHGSMSEVAEGGGAVLVDPRDVHALANAMRSLLTDDDLYQRLRQEAVGRTWKSWDRYAQEVWEFLTAE